MSNCLVLTFDDGLTPGTRLITAILGILAEHGAKATFFLLGKHLPERKAIVQRIAAEGHEIGLHGYEHLNQWKAFPLRVLKDIKNGWKAIDAALGTHRGVYPFRPPYGKLNLICLLYLWIHRVPIVFWTFDLGDTWPLDKQDSQRTAALVKEPGGAVVLAHNFDRTDENANKRVLELVQSTLTQAKEKRMPILKVSQFLNS
jgi:peptidoglycan/xylan/chitin deacetylase (PgdA/CDA1 family)